MFLIVGSGNFGLAVTGPVPMPLSLETIVRSRSLDTLFIDNNSQHNGLLK